MSRAQEAHYGRLAFSGGQGEIHHLLTDLFGNAVVDGLCGVAHVLVHLLGQLDDLCPVFSQELQLLRILGVGQLAGVLGGGSTRLVHDALRQAVGSKAYRSSDIHTRGEDGW